MRNLHDIRAAATFARAPAQSQAQQPAVGIVAPLDEADLHALPLPHCHAVGVVAHRQLLGLLSRREAYALAHALIKGADQLPRTAEQVREGLARFDQEFSTPLTTIFDAVVPLPIADLEHPIHPATHITGG